MHVAYGLPREDLRKWMLFSEQLQNIPQLICISSQRFFVSFDVASKIDAFYTGGKVQVSLTYCTCQWFPPVEGEEGRSGIPAGVYGRFDTKLFRYKSFRYKPKSFRYTCKVVSIHM